MIILLQSHKYVYYALLIISLYGKYLYIINNIMKTSLTL